MVHAWITLLFIKPTALLQSTEIPEVKECLHPQCNLQMIAKYYGSKWSNEYRPLCDREEDVEFAYVHQNKVIMHYQ